MINEDHKNRPLSPHLTIYRPQFTSVMSILHRITGVGLIFSLLIAVIWFCSLSLGPKYFALVRSLIGTTVVKGILGLSLWALWYHFFTGIRHLFWDFGYGFDLSTAKWSALLVIFSSTVCFVTTILVF